MRPSNLTLGYLMPTSIQKKISSSSAMCDHPFPPPHLSMYICFIYGNGFLEYCQSCILLLRHSPIEILTLRSLSQSFRFENLGIFS
jgi:hypothetical protein